MEAMMRIESESDGGGAVPTTLSTIRGPVLVVLGVERGVDLAVRVLVRR
jgi:hypothetical protein